MTAKPRAPRSPDELTTLDEFLAEEGKLEAFKAIAIEEVLAWQSENAVKEVRRSQAHRSADGHVPQPGEPSAPSEGT